MSLKEGPRRLPTFRGCTVDTRLREFRRAIVGKTLAFIGFDTPQGQRLLAQYHKKRGKLWIATEVFQLIIQDVHVFRDFQSARDWFKEYTGMEYPEDGKRDDEFYARLPEDYDQTKIFEAEVSL